MNECKVRSSDRARMVVYANKRGYRVNDDGSVTGRKGKKLRNKPGNCGYIRFSIRDPTGHQRQVSVHQLMAYQKFGEAALFSGVHVRHLDGNRTNNHIDNIVIGDARDNSMDRPKRVRIAMAKHAASFTRKLTPSQIESLRDEHAEGSSLRILCTKYGIAKSTASYIVNRKMYKDVT